MGFLGKLFGGQQQAPETADPRLVGVFAFPPDNPSYRKREAEKALTRESSAVMAILGGSGETCLIAAHDAANNTLVVVTDQQTFTVKQGSIRQQLRHDQVAGTRITSAINQNIGVWIESHESRLDYAPDDVMRYSKIIHVDVATPQIANAICAEIDHRLGQ